MCVCVCLSVIFFFFFWKMCEEVDLESEDSGWSPAILLWRWAYSEKVKRECVCVRVCASTPVWIR